MTKDNDKDSTSSSSLSSSTSPSLSSAAASDDDDNMKIDPEYIQKLEALFSKSSLDNDTTKNDNSSNSKDEDFFDSIGSHIEEVSPPIIHATVTTTPLMMAQNWIGTNDPLIVKGTKYAFTVSDATHVDEAYEFVFSNLGMQTTKFLHRKNNNNNNNKRVRRVAEDDTTITNTDTDTVIDIEESDIESDLKIDDDDDDDDDGGAQKRQYLFMPHFLSNSATSMEKFVAQTEKIIQTLPLLPLVGDSSDGDNHNNNKKGVVDISCLHPEHVDKEKRCPIPVIVLQWKD